METMNLLFSECYAPLPVCINSARIRLMSLHLYNFTFFFFFFFFVNFKLYSGFNGISMCVSTFLMNWLKECLNVLKSCFQLSLSRLAQAVMLLNCIPELPGLNLGSGTNYTN
jgi:hypothetical protein